MSKVEFFFFGTQKRPLYGALFAPENGRCKRALVICDSLFEEKFWCERIHTNLGLFLAERGTAVLSFDYSGYGNSPGESSDVDLSTMENDVIEACNFLGEMGADRIALYGVRWGAAVACSVARRRKDIDRIFLVEPVDDWKSAMRKTLQINVAGQYAIFKKVIITRDEILNDLVSGKSVVRSGYRMNNVEGYVFSKSFVEQSASARLPVELPGTVDSVTVFRLREGGKGGEAVDDNLVEAFQSMGINCESVTLHGESKIWEYNRIFTSVAPALYGEIGDRLSNHDREGAAESEWTVNTGRVFPTIDTGHITESAVTFESDNEHRLDGVLYLPPAGEMKKTGIIFSHGGLMGMNGAFRFNTRAARHFARIGYPCLCFDPHGFGRAGGVIKTMDRRILFRRIQSGLFKRDTVHAVRFFRERVGDIRIMLFGVCGGSITNIITHSLNRDVISSVQLSIPIMLTSVSDRKQRMSAGFARFYLGLYLRKIFNPKSWWRFITFQSKYDMIFKSIRVYLRHNFNRIASFKWLERGSGTAARKTEGKKTADGRGLPARKTQKGMLPTSAITLSSTDLNPAFLKAYRAIIGRGDRMLFIFGENDTLKWEFNSEFVDKLPEEFEAGGDLVEVAEIKHANHMYTLREWQDAIIECSREWMERVGLT